MSGRVKKGGVLGTVKHVASLELVPETAPAAAASSGEVLIQAENPRCELCKQQTHPPEVSHVLVTLAQDVLLNGVLYKAGNQYHLPDDAFGTWKYAVAKEE